MTSNTEQNKKLVQTYIEDVWGRMDATVAGKYKRADFIDHLPGGKTTTTLADFQAHLREIFTKLTKPIEAQCLLVVAEGDYVVTRHLAKLPLPPSGELKETGLIDIYRFKDGLIAEHWDQFS
jgi:predicted SnoaL-like aldol condensation-catalyzing enzyme